MIKIIRTICLFLVYNSIHITATNANILDVINNPELNAIIDQESINLLLRLGKAIDYVFNDNKTYPPIGEDVKFYCVKPNTNTPIQILINDTNINNILDSNINGVAFVIHGWMSSVDDWALETSIYWANNATKTVCAIDWSRLSSYNYLTAAFNHTHLVANYTVKFINFLNTLDPVRLSLDRITITGHSLGAEIAGFIGQNFNGQIGQIFALDPPGLGFTFPIDFGAENRLTQDDAINVQAIHTASLTAGELTACGKSDYYPNGGAAQPGCDLINSICSHDRAYELFTAALDKQVQFNGIESSSYWEYLIYAILGLRPGNHDIFGIWTKNYPGTYYFCTTSTPPYVK